MKVLIDIGHPAHVHVFRNLADELEKDGHKVLFTCRDKECTLSLLKGYDLPYVCLGKPFKSTIGKLAGLLWFDLKMLIVLLRFRPDLTMGHSSMYAAQASWLLGIPHISVEDTGNMEQIRLYRPFTKAILVPECFHLDLGRKQIRYPGNHELAYLHPSRFVPDIQRLKENGFDPGKPYVIMRFVAWRATHDKGHQGISVENKLKALTEFSKYATVYISSETKLPPEFQKYLLAIPPERIHDAIAFASLLYGESATMASEAAVLGVPAIFIDNTGRCYTREEEKFNLVFNFTESPGDQEKSIEKGVELLRSPNLREEWSHRRNLFLKEKIDVTTFLRNIVENWPESFRALQRH